VRLSGRAVISAAAYEAEVRGAPVPPRARRRSPSGAASHRGARPCVGGCVRCARLSRGERPCPPAGTVSEF
jgi:hypothetical protein